MHRRVFLQHGMSAMGTGLVFSSQSGDEKLPPVRAITRGPKFHWFGYYDKLQFDPSGRYVLGMEIDFEHRSPKPDDVVGVGMVDLHEGDKWIPLGQTRAWNWQQGCMLQWLPGSKTDVIWNDRVGGRFVAHVLNTKSGEKRTLDSAIYTLSGDAKVGIAPDFRRLNDMRPGYGYAGIPDPNKSELAPSNVGIWSVDLQTGRQKLLFSIADIVKFPDPARDWKGAKHWFNHLLISPDDKRFIFLHRWRMPGQKSGFSTRLLTADLDGSNLYVLDPHGQTSHFIWRDPEHILAWAWHPSAGNRFYLYRDRTEVVAVVGEGVMTVNGHCTYLPGNKWILNDTYPDKERLQHPYLFEVSTSRKVPLGHFASPAIYGGEWRCDTHPRFSPDGKWVCIDSPHDGKGRQMYLIDVRSIVGE